ncbi:response regulator [bacterium]|nr:response regulator [bacterium]RQV96339.1 MAG: response regulator [bacterium]
MVKDGIVVIDDDQSVLKAFEKVLSAQDFSITTYNRSESVLNMIRQKKPKIVIIDMKMSDENNRELMNKIKQIDDNIVIIVMTSYSNILTKRNAYLLGADDYLQKPFEISAMISSLKRLISKERHTKLVSKG